MATTRLMALHIRKGHSASESIRERLDYIENPEKTKDGELVTSFGCNPKTAWADRAGGDRFITLHLPCGT